MVNALLIIYNQSKQLSFSHINYVKLLNEYSAK